MTQNARDAMFIEIDTTATPDRLRFRPGRSVVSSGAVAFDDVETASRSPLARRLLAVEGVVRVSLESAHVVIDKAPTGDWQRLKPVLLGILMEHFLSGAPAVVAVDPPAAPEHDPTDGEIVAEIAAVIDERIRPPLATVGASLAFLAYRQGSVVLDLANAGAAGPLFGLRIKIENTLRYYVPEVVAVTLVGPDSVAPEATLDLDDPETAAVHALLETRINPAVAHGGHIALIAVEDHTVHIRLEGGCQGCGMADVTLKQGVEAAILDAVSSIVAVRDATDHAGGDNPYYQPGKAGMTPI